MVEDMLCVLEALLDAPSPELRASAAFALGCLLPADHVEEGGSRGGPPPAEAGPQQRYDFRWCLRPRLLLN